jgi:D-cysteine desulfhydrase family pyridoxal phosphate-dependent enzyme
VNHWCAPRGIHDHSAAKTLEELMRNREQLAVLPTPLHHAPRLSRTLGHEVWIKRDDLTGLGLGGNKVRKLELLAGDAHRHGADTLVSVGAPQSNHARTVAAVAAMLGLDCHLVLAGPRPHRPTGNLALDVFYGAEPHFTGSHDWADLHDTSQALTQHLRSQGRTPYAIPIGGSTELGVVAFAAAYLELVEQLHDLRLDPATVLHASSSGGTQAGLELGRRLTQHGPHIVGVDVAKITTSLTDQIRRLLNDAAPLLNVTVANTEPAVLEEYLGDGYAIPTTQSHAAMRLLATTEGILADPVYTAKALHALYDQHWQGPVIFWHTGGVPALFSDESGLHVWPENTS